MLFGVAASQCPQRGPCSPLLQPVATGHQPFATPRVTPPTPAAVEGAGHAASAAQSLEAATAAARVEEEEEEEDVDSRGVALLRGCQMRHLPTEILETVSRMAIVRIHRLFVPRMRLRLLLRRREQLTQEARRQARWLSLAEGDLARNAARRFLTGVPPGVLARLLRVEQGCVEGYPPGASVVLPACDLNRSLMIVFEGSLVVRRAGQRREAVVHATAAVGDFFIASPLSSINVGVRAGNERAFVIHIPFSRFEGLCADLTVGRTSGAPAPPQTALDASVLGMSFSNASLGGFHAPPHATAAAVPTPPVSLGSRSTFRPATDASSFAGLTIMRPPSPFRSDHDGTIGTPTALRPHPPSALRAIASGGGRPLAGAGAADAAPVSPQALLVAKALNAVSFMGPRSPGGGRGLLGRCSAAVPAPVSSCPPDRRKSALANALEQYMRLAPRRRSCEDSAGWHAQASAQLTKLHPPAIYPPAAAEHHQRRGSGGCGPPKSPMAAAAAAAAAACWEKKKREQQRRQRSAHRRRRRQRHCRQLFAETRRQVAAVAEAGRRRCERGEGDCDWLPPVGVDPDHLCYRRGRKQASPEADPPSLERPGPMLEILSHAAFDPQSAIVVFADDDDF